MSSPTSLLLLLSIASASAGCLASDADSLASGQSAITGGSPEAGYPSVFALAYNGEGGCTGTCIAPHIGLTAAHCVEGEEASVLSALFGATEAAPTQVIQVTEVLSEPSYATDTRGADIALLRFAEACPATTPYNSLPLESHIGEAVVMVGFGVTLESANDAGIKRSGVATLFSVTESEVSGMNPGELATSNDPHGTCNGDSGGPTFMRFGGVEYVVGVTSRGSTDASGMDAPCGQGRSIAARPDSYAAFIDAFMGVEGGDTMPPGDDLGPDDEGGRPEEEPSENPSPGQEVVVSGCQAAAASTSQAAFLWMLLALALLARRQRRER